MPELRPAKKWTFQINQLLFSLVRKASQKRKSSRAESSMRGNSHEDDERDFPPSDIAAPSICVLLYC